MLNANTADLEWQTIDRGETEMRRKELADAADGEGIGCSLYELPPGGKSWPYHYHTANEEAMYVLSGTGIVRTPEGRQEVTEGEYVAFPADERGAHTVYNESDSPLRYLALSTMVEPDVCVYSDSEKLGVFVGSAPGGPDERPIHGFYPLEGTVDYWEDE